MNFPDSELITFLYTLINTPGFGGILVALLGGGIVLSVGLTLRWIIQGGKADEPEIYVYPTSALIHEHEPE